MIKLNTRGDVIEQILFELIVLSTDVPVEDQEVSLTTICSLSELPQDVSAILVQSGLQLIKQAGGYEVWKSTYVGALMQNNRMGLAHELNEAAETLLG